MQRYPVSPAVEVVATALLLRRASPTWPALDVLDQAMAGRIGRRIDFRGLAAPPSPFALLIAEAFDGGMLPCDWTGLMRPGSPLRVRELLAEVWADEVWPKFAARYCQWGPTTASGAARGA